MSDDHGILPEGYQEWTRAMLAHHIDTKLYGRQGQADTNFSRTLPAPQSDLAQRNGGV